MLTSVLNLFHSTPVTTPIAIDGKPNFVVDGYAKLVQNPLFDKAETALVTQIKRVFVHHRLPIDSPLHAKVNAVLAKSPLAMQPRVDHHMASHLKTQMLAKPRVSSDTVYVQNCQTLKETKAAIKANGANWNEVVLNSADDETLELLATTCTQLTTLRIILRGNGINQDLTDAGLQHIAALPALSTLELSIWMATNLSSNGLQQLFSQSTLQNNLKELTLVTFLLGDTLMGILAKCSQLQKFSTQTTSLTPQGVAVFLQSNTIKNSLQSFSSYMGSCWGTLIDNSVLLALAGVSNLNAVMLNGQWNATDQNLLTFLQAKNKLNTLGLSGYTISAPIMDQIATMSPLTSLTLGDCSKIYQYEGLINGLVNLNTLYLGNTAQFTDANLVAVSKMNQLTSLSLVGASYFYEGLKAFSSSPAMIKNLSTLYLSGNSIIPPHYLGCLNKLENITTLRLENISYFNDESLRLLTGTPSAIKNSLQVLELNGVSISDATMGRFSSFPKLKTLMLTDCYALTKKGTTTFIHDPKLQNQLQNLYFSGESIDLNLIKDLNLFTGLQKLYLGNMVGLNQSPRSKELKTLWNLPNLKKNNTEISVFDGELTSFAQFLEGL